MLVPLPHLLGHVPSISSDSVAQSSARRHRPDQACQQAAGSNYGQPSPLQLVTLQDDGTVKSNALLSPQGTMAIGMAAAIRFVFAALRVAQAPRHDFDYEPR